MGPRPKPRGGSGGCWFLWLVLVWSWLVWLWFGYGWFWLWLVFGALSENLTKRPLLRNFLHPLNREELDVGHRHPLGLQQQIPQVLIAPAAVNQHTNVPVHRFHHSEAYLRAAVVHYTFEVFEQHV